MIQVLPSAKNLGDFIGQGLGQGVKEGMKEDTMYQRNRGRLQEGLDEVSKAANAGGSDLDVMLKSLSALAGIPGHERYADKIIPMILQNSRANKLFGDKSGRGMSSQGVDAARNVGMQQEQQGMQQGGRGEVGIPTDKPATMNVEGLPQPQEPSNQGVLPDIETAAQQQDFAKEYALVNNDPQAYAQGLAIAQNRNKLNQDAIDRAQEKAKSIGVTDEQLPFFMQIGKRYGHMNDLNKWAISTNKDFKEYNNATKTLDNVFVPGFTSGLLGRDRQDLLKKLDGPVERLVNLGFEQEVRQKLASEYLSPTEVEERIHPITPEQIKNIEKLPKSRAMRSKDLPGERMLNFLPDSIGNKFKESTKEIDKNFSKETENISKFLEKNVNDKTSLLVLRDKLWADKGYDWQLLSDAFRNAKIKYNAAQNNELTQIDTEPPKQSLSDIFREPNRIVEYIRGNK